MRRTKCNLRTSVFIGLALVFPFASLGVAPSQTFAAGGEVRVLSAVGMRQVMLDLGPKFEHATGYRLKVSFDSGGMILNRLERGEAADLVIINQSSIESLTGKGRLVRGSVVDLAKSVVGVAVRKGAPKPDISTPELLSVRCSKRQQLHVLIRPSEVPAESTLERFSSDLVLQRL